MAVDSTAETGHGRFEIREGAPELSSEDRLVIDLVTRVFGSGKYGFKPSADYVAPDLEVVRTGDDITVGPTDPIPSTTDTQL